MRQNNWKKTTHQIYRTLNEMQTVNEWKLFPRNVHKITSFITFRSLEMSQLALESWLHVSLYKTLSTRLWRLQVIEFPLHKCEEPQDYDIICKLFKFLWEVTSYYGFLLINSFYIHNWPLQPFSQDYWPSFSHHLCFVC